MKWIKVKSEKDLPKGDNPIWIVRTTVDGTVRVHQWTTGHLAEIALLRNKNTYSIEWLDESINQDVSDIRVGNIGSDWKEKFKKTWLYQTEDVAWKKLVLEIEDWIEENVIAPLLQNEYKGDDLVAEASTNEGAAEATHYVAASLPHNNIEQGEDMICPVTKLHCDDECCHAVVEIKCHQKVVAANINDPFIEKHLTRIKKKIKETTEWWEANRDKPLYVQCLPSDKDAFNIPNSNLWLRRTVFVFEDLQVPYTSSQTLTQEQEEKYYPGIQYQRLFNAISETKGIALQSDMDEIIRIVHEDFPLWISVNDRLPDCKDKSTAYDGLFSERVLIVEEHQNKQRIDISNCRLDDINVDGFIAYKQQAPTYKWGIQGNNMNVTHWMPLPKCPTELVNPERNASPRTPNQGDESGNQNPSQLKEATINPVTELLKGIAVVKGVNPDLIGGEGL